MVDITKNKTTYVRYAELNSGPSNVADVTRAAKSAPDIEKAMLAMN